ncbi:PGF-CTERM-anchored ABC transporter substrate-binding protein [Halocalculus aciditolerans]|uniref:Fe/B12 periplasmic-binding domain-containing protein n=1 Tax=Halocalculus aciditolerans TaxID=1383812 RepID=A0A830FF28_9EURY|nr:PGF-CTERM-anchored ABC transporter substrate-binding protein [Halocalculus aciditolerans]GGL68668.1 hypothetical protein GCM10009039_28310 [Halocalculus aciditolerans]
MDTPPERIVTLSPSAAQIVWEIGAADRVVGVTGSASYLDGASEKADVSGSGMSYVDQEKVVSLEPDLVLAPDTISDETVGTLRDSGLTVYHYEAAESIADIKEQTHATGRLTGNCDGASETVSTMESRLATVDEATSGTDRPGVLYTFYGYTAGSETFIDNIITLAGGTNVAAEAGITGYKEISSEVIVQQNPEWIVRNSQNPSVPKTSAYNSTDAVKNGNVVVLDNNYLNQPAPRVVQPITTLAKALHPESWGDGTETDSTDGNEEDDHGNGNSGSSSHHSDQTTTTNLTVNATNQTVNATNQTVNVTNQSVGTVNFTANGTKQTPNETAVSLANESTTEEAETTSTSTETTRDTTTSDTTTSTTTPGFEVTAGLMALVLVMLIGRRQ